MTSLFTKFIEEAEVAYANNSYLSSIMTALIALELALKEELSMKGLQTKQKTLGSLLNDAVKTSIINEKQMEQMRELLYIRNAAAHMGKVPSRKTSIWVLEYIKEFLKSIS